MARQAADPTDLTLATPSKRFDAWPAHNLHLQSRMYLVPVDLECDGNCLPTRNYVADAPLPWRIQIWVCRPATNAHRSRAAAKRYVAQARSRVRKTAYGMDVPVFSSMVSP